MNSDPRGGEGAGGDGGGGASSRCPGRGLGEEPGHCETEKGRHGAGTEGEGLESGGRPQHGAGPLFWVRQKAAARFLSYERRDVAHVSQDRPVCRAECRPAVEGRQWPPGDRSGAGSSQRCKRCQRPGRGGPLVAAELGCGRPWRAQRPLAWPLGQRCGQRSGTVTRLPILQCVMHPLGIGAAGRGA